MGALYFFIWIQTNVSSPFISDWSSQNKSLLDTYSLWFCVSENDLIFPTNFKENFDRHKFPGGFFFFLSVLSWLWPLWLVASMVMTGSRLIWLRRPCLWWVTSFCCFIFLSFSLFSTVKYCCIQVLMLSKLSYLEVIDLLGCIGRCFH